jgi:uncharacterized protein
MSATAKVVGLFLYPIKSLDLVRVDLATVLPGGSLQGDREFALFDGAGHYVNGKRHESIHRVRSQIDLASRQVTLHVEGHKPSQTFPLAAGEPTLETWFNDYFGFSVTLKQDQVMGFPDDTVSPGPTIISTATLEAIAGWYPGLTVEEVRARFRANIELGDVPPFWEDCLFTTAASTYPFKIGAVQFSGVNPCQRCVVVTRNPATGEAYPNFQKTFVANRKETLPNEVERSRFNHFFRLAINTRIPGSEVGKTIRVGDPLQLLNRSAFPA